MKKNNFLGTFLFLILLSSVTCSAEKLTINKGFGMPVAGFGNMPQVAIKVLQDGENIIPEEYDLRNKFAGFEGFMNITDYSGVVFLNKPGSCIEIIAKVFGGNLKSGALKYLNGSIRFRNIIVPTVSDIKVTINLDGKKVEFENIPFEYKDTPSFHNKAPYAGVWKKIPTSRSENAEDYDNMAGF